MLRPGSFRVFDLVSVSFEFRFCACVLSWVEILSTLAQYYFVHGSSIRTDMDIILLARSKRRDQARDLGLRVFCAARRAVRTRAYDR